MDLDGSESAAPAAASTIFGDRLELAGQYVDLLERHGVDRGLIGPREADRLWDRHVLNSAVIGEVIPEGARVIDVGSGAGLPGVPLAISRPDLDIVLLEPMARRVDWLTEVSETLSLSLTVLRGRAEEKQVREHVGLADVVTARAVAPLARLAGWCLPLVRPKGSLAALKGASAHDEIERDRVAITKAGGGDPSLTMCGSGVLDTSTTVVLIERTEKRKTGRSRRQAGARSR